MRAVLALPEPQLWLTRFGDERYRFALSRVSDEAKAQDLVQETLVSALDALNSFRSQPWSARNYRCQTRHPRYPYSAATFFLPTGLAVESDAALPRSLNQFFRGELQDWPASRV